MKKTLIKYKKLLIGFLLVFIPVMFMSTYRIEYSFKAPGLTDNISTFIVIEDSYYSSSSFHTTSVIVLNKITIIQYLLGTWEQTVSVEEFPEYYSDIDIKDIYVMGYLMKDDSLATSLIVGIENSGYSVDYETYLTVYLTFNYLTSDSLKLGDKILTIDGSTDYDTAINNVACGDAAEFEIIREDEEMIVHAVKSQHDDGTCTFGMYLGYFTEILDTEINYEIIETDTGGPSGGLMQALYVYYNLVESDLETGLKIAGTGTIDVFGDVGYIGGIRQKIITASLNNVDIFFVPHLSDDDNDNYIKALEVYNTLDTDMVLVGVSNFTEALEYLNNYTRGDSNE